MTFASRAVEEFKTGDSHGQQPCLSAIETFHSHGVHTALNLKQRSGGEAEEARRTQKTIIACIAQVVIRGLADIPDP